VSERALSRGYSGDRSPTLTTVTELTKDGSVRQRLQEVNVVKISVLQLGSLGLPAYETLERLRLQLRDLIDNPRDCECCGYKALKNPYLKDGHIVGPECYNHPLGTCKAKRDDKVK